MVNLVSFMYLEMLKYRKKINIETKHKHEINNYFSGEWTVKEIEHWNSNK